MLKEAGAPSRLSGGFPGAGVRELSRKLSRAVNRGAILLENRRLKKAEIHLGWLGWQQAEFSEEVFKNVDEINSVERQQGHLLNERAEIAEKITAFQEEQAAKEAEATGILEQIARERAPLAVARETAAARFAEKEREVREAQSHLKKLTRKEAVPARQLKTLRKTFPPPGDLRAQLLSIQGRTNELAIQKREVKNSLSLLQKTLRPLAADLKLRQSLLATLDRKTKKIRSAQASAARKLHRQIRSAERRKAGMERQGQSLEKRKKLPFLKIGRALADNAIGPINQPEALEEVLRLRENIRHRGQVIAESLAASLSEDPAELKKFYILCSILAAVLLIALAFVAEHTGYHAR